MKRRRVSSGIKRVVIVFYFQDDLSHSEALQYLLSLAIFTLSSSYLVYIIILYF